MPTRSRAAKVAGDADANEVTAVIVSHDGALWLPEVIEAVRAGSVRPTRVVCADTGSEDGSAGLLAAAFGDVLRLPRDTGYGAAVAAALDQSGPGTGYLWLLHDDSAPEPDALAALLDEADRDPAAALLGPKVRDWADPRVLVEVGLTTDASGHRETGLERREYDQGQHDDVREVLAVGTAGALVRRAAWDAVGGLDPALPLFRDDLDLGWRLNSAGHRVVVVPAARVRHVRAATTGRRAPGAAPGRATGVDRRHALFVLLAHAGPGRLAVLLPQLVLASLARVLGFLVSRQVAAAGDELRALTGVLVHPRRLHAARRQRRAQRTRRPRELAPLFASRAHRALARAEALGDWLSRGRVPGGGGSGALGDPDPEGPDALMDLDDGREPLLRRVVRRPAVLLALGLTIVALAAERHLLPFGGGTLAGGRLLPVPAGAHDLWATYLSSWHPVGVGSTRPSPPSVALLATLSTVLLGKPWLALDLVLLASVPAAGVVAFLASRRVVENLVLRLWAGAVWALAPVAVGGVAAGRVDVAVVQLLLPPLAVVAARVVRTDPAAGGWRRAWGLGLLLSVALAFAPPLWPLALLLPALAAARALGRPAPDRPGSWRSTAAAAVAVLTPAVLLLPWSLSLLARPGLLLQAGGRLVDDPALVGAGTWHLALLAPGGAAAPVWWAGAGLVAAGLGSLLRRDRWGTAVTAWAVVLVAVVVAVAESRVRVAAAAGPAVPVWPGAPVQVAGAALVVAALVAGEGARARLARSSFGPRQLLAALVAAAAALTPVVVGVGWAVRGADRPVTRSDTARLPAFVRAEVATTPGLRVLMVGRLASGAVAYQVVGAGGGSWGDSETPPSRAQTAALDAAVADLVTPSGSDAAEALSTRAVRYVALQPGRGPDELALVLDAQGGLTRRDTGKVLLWQVVAPSARLSLLPPDLATLARTGARAPTRELLRTSPPSSLPAGPEGAAGDVPPGPPGRLLVLAVARDNGWQARMAGRGLPPVTAWGWAQAFLLPSTGGHLEVRHSSSGRRAALALQAAAVLVAVILAAPAVRRRRGLEVEGDDEPTDDGSTGDRPLAHTSREGAP